MSSANEKAPALGTKTPFCSQCGWMFRRYKFIEPTKMEGKIPGKPYVFMFFMEWRAIILHFRVVLVRIRIFECFTGWRVKITMYEIYAICEEHYDSRGCAARIPTTIKTPRISAKIRCRKSTIQKFTKPRKNAKHLQGSRQPQFLRSFRCHQIFLDDFWRYTHFGGIFVVHAVLDKRVINLCQ